MELIADTAGVIVYDDYGHHPTEVRATLAAMRQKVGDRRLWAVFEPHMYSRTALFLDEFAHALHRCRRGRHRRHLRLARHRCVPARHLGRGAGRRDRAHLRRLRPWPAATSTPRPTYVAEHLRRRRRGARDGGGEVVPDRPGPQGSPRGRRASTAVARPRGAMSGARSAVLGRLPGGWRWRCCSEGLVGLVEASGAKDQPAAGPDPAAGGLPGPADRGRDARMRRCPARRRRRCWCWAGSWCHPCSGPFPSAATDLFARLGPAGRQPGARTRGCDSCRIGDPRSARRGTLNPACNAGGGRRPHTE